MTTHLAITGWGLISPLGLGAWETFQSLLAGRTISDRLPQLPASLDPVSLVRAIGCVAAVQHVAGDPLVELIERATREALFAAGALTPVDPAKTVVIAGSSKGAAHALNAAADLPAGRKQGSPLDAPLAVALGPHGYLAYHLSRRLGIPDIRPAVAACALGPCALHQARRLLTQGPSGDRPARVLVVSGEAALLPVFIASYQRLGVLSPLSTDGAYRPAPLDQRRNGFVLSELAAALVVEPVAALSPGQIELLDTAEAAEGYDLVRPAPCMPALGHVVERLASRRAIDVIHAHATGTGEHDPMELEVYSRHAPGRPDVYAVKGALGHGLGAAGLVSLVVACMCAKTNRRPVMPWLTQPLEAPALHLASRPSQGRDCRTHAVFATGFGGHVAGAVVARA